MAKNKSLKRIVFSILSLSIVACNATNTKITDKEKTTVIKSQYSTPQSVTNKKAPLKKVSPKKATSSVVSSIPAWRRAASPTMTRGAQDAIFPAAKNGDLRLLKKLLAEGVDINYQNFNGETILHIAASRGDLAMVRYLVSKGADVNAKTGKLWLPIHHAMRFEHPQVANYLIAHNASINAKTSDGLTALDLAKTSKKSGMKEIIKRYLK